jgi:pyruvate dehydrogenase E1 component alpha subunit
MTSKAYESTDRTSRGSATSERSDGAMPHDGPAGRRRIDVGSMDQIQILSPDGQVDETHDPRLPAEELLRIYRAMVLTRVFDVRMLNMQRQGQMGTFAPSYGQEATQIGQVYPLTRDDWYAPSYRSFGAQIWRGWDMERLLLLWDGFFEGFPPPPGVNDLPFSIVIGSHVPLAVGVAMGMRKRGDRSAMLTNFGDGAMSQGVVAESLNFASVYQAPVVFVCENNGWAISTRTEQQAGVDTLAKRGPGFGVPSMRVDGNDVLAMIVATTEAVERARRGEGPVLIEAITYRMSLHTTADDPKVYRDPAEVEAWKSKDPLRRMEQYLIGRQLLDADAIRQIQESCEADVRSAREGFRARAKANPREIFDFVYAPLPPELEEQKQEYLRKLDRKK